MLVERFVLTEIKTIIIIIINVNDEIAIDYWSQRTVVECDMIKVIITCQSVRAGAVSVSPPPNTPVRPTQKFRLNKHPVPA